jgi:hypothetical protein
MWRRILDVGAGLSAFLLSRFLAVSNEDFLLEFIAPLLFFLLIKKLVEFDNLDHILATVGLSTLLSLPVLFLFLSFIGPGSTCMPEPVFEIQEPVEVNTMSGEGVSRDAFDVQAGAEVVYDEPCDSASRRTISVGLVDNKVIEKPVPRLTAAERWREASGTVVVRVLIDVLTGKVVCANAVSGPAELRRAAKAAARHARFSPAHICVDGILPPVEGVLTYRFESP